MLPFDNLSRDPDNAYFAEGVQDEILTRLAKVADLKVISRTSTQKYKSAPDNLRDIAKQLGVSNILEGSVQRAADQVRVTVQLINATNDAHLWAETYDRKLTDIFTVESEIAKTIADTLRAKLTGSEERMMSKKPTANPEAYEFYLKGRFFWNKRTGVDLRKAIDYFNQAVAKDPSYALAYAGLADAYVLLSGFGAASPKDSLPEAKAAAEKGLDLDGTLGEAHASLAQALLAYDFNFARANREFRRAIELNPNYATAHHWYGESVLTPLGQFEDGVAELKRALQLDPLSVIINADVGTVLTSARRYDEAIRRQLVRARDNQLDRAGTVIADRPRQRDCLLAHRFAHFGRDEGRRRFLDHFLVAALDRAFAFAEVEDVAVLVAQDLDLDVPRLLDELLDEHAIVTKAR